MADPLGLIPNSQGPGSILPRPSGATPSQPGAPAFKDVLMKQIEQVNSLQQEAAMAVEDLATGRRTDLDAVNAAKAKADLAFSMLLQVRNKMMDAYEEVKQIRV